MTHMLSACFSAPPKIFGTQPFGENPFLIGVKKKLTMLVPHVETSAGMNFNREHPQW